MASLILLGRIFFTLDNAKTALDASFLTDLRWWFQLRFSSKWTPLQIEKIHFTSNSYSIFIFIIICFKPIFYFRELKIFQITQRKLFEERCGFLSSTKRIVKNVDALERSLIRIKNKIGPNIDPCSTPQEICLCEESTPLNEVNCFLPYK